MKQKIINITLISIIIILTGVVFYFIVLPQYNKGIYAQAYYAGTYYTFQSGNLPYYYNDTQTGKLIYNETTLTAYCNQWVDQQLKLNNLTIVKRS